MKKFTARSAHDRRHRNRAKYIRGVTPSGDTSSFSLSLFSHLRLVVFYTNPIRRSGYLSFEMSLIARIALLVLALPVVLAGGGGDSCGKGQFK